jgi:hypothetical protein
MKKKTNILPVSRLKGISIYYNNDLYDLASLMLKLNDARSNYEGSNSKSRPTINGLAKRFAELINLCSPDYAPVMETIKKHRLPLGAMIEFDENI